MLISKWHYVFRVFSQDAKGRASRLREHQEVMVVVVIFPGICVIVCVSHGGGGERVLQRRGEH